MYVLIEKATYTAIIKKSRFEAIALTVENEEQALELVEKLGDPKATHNCWAYKIGDKYRSSDDGEPGGTAGRPILTAIESQEVDSCLIVVTRYFGGIKLGAGGLVRAYGGTASECLRVADKKEVKPLKTLVINVPFAFIGEFYSLLEKYHGTKKGENFGEEGLCLRVEIVEDNADLFVGALADATRGAAIVE